MTTKHRLSNTGTLQTNTYFDEFSDSSGSLSFTRISVNPPDGGLLTVPNDASLKLGANNFTIEFWAYPTDTSGTTTVVTTGTDLSFSIIGGGSWYYGLSSSGTTQNITGGVVKSFATPILNRWQHVALVRNGNVFTPYLNGVAGANTTSSSALFDYTTNLQLGDISNGFGGYLSNFRIVKGTALYTSNFTPPNQPLDVIANTSILLLANNGNPYKDSSSNNFTTTRNSAVVANALTPFVNKPKITSNRIIGLLNEVTNPGPKMRMSNTGIIYVSSVFDEYTGIE